MAKHSKTRVNRLLEKQLWVCYWCKEKSDVYHIDHIKPVSRWWDNLEYNMCIACKFCNLLKSDLPSDWYSMLISYYKLWKIEKHNLKLLKKILFTRNRKNVENSYDLNWLLVRHLDWLVRSNRKIDISILYNKW